MKLKNGLKFRIFCFAKNVAFIRISFIENNAKILVFLRNFAEKLVLRKNALFVIFFRESSLTNSIKYMVIHFFTSKVCWISHVVPQKLQIKISNPYIFAT